MVVREKTAKGHTYLYLVESVREGGRVRQRIIRALGRKDALVASGELDRLAMAFARYSQPGILLSDMAAGRLACTRIGGPLLFGRLWEQLGMAEVLAGLLHGRGFEFLVERAVFAGVLHLRGVGSPQPHTSACSCPSRIAPARSGSPTTPFPAPTVCSCTISTVPWPGWVRSASRWPTVPWRRAV